MNKFQKAIEFTLKWEAGTDRKGNLREDGGYVIDTGGETKWGISKKANPDLDIKNLTKEKAIEIYRTKYWGVMNCDSYNVDVAVAMFDTGVNCGTNRTKEWFKLVEKTKDPAKKLIALREGHYFNLSSIDRDKYQKFMNGWLNRTNDLKKYIDIIRVEVSQEGHSK